jgi:Helix-turn-helix domain
MRATPQPPPEALLIRACREAPPKMSMRSAAQAASISPTRWRQIEDGGSLYRGRWEPESAPAATLARMARAVGVTGAELESAGRPDAAAELAALGPAPDRPLTAEETLHDLVRRMEELERRVERRDSGDGDVNGGRNAV